MGEKNEGKKGEENSGNVVLKVDMHCDGCASKIIRSLRGFPGVETVKVERATEKVTVTGKVDATKLKEKLSKKTKKKVELLSPPQPKKDNNNNNQKGEKKNGEKKAKEEKEPPVVTAVLKVALHCQGCVDKIVRTVKRTKGVHDMAIDHDKETVTVKGTMDAKNLAQNLTEKLKKKVEVVPPKKDKENGGGGENGGSAKKNKNKGGGDDQNNMLMEHNSIMESMAVANPPPPFGFGYGVPPPHGYGYGYGYGHGNVVGGYAYVPVYPNELHFHGHAPQMFSDENPNACSFM